MAIGRRDVHYFGGSLTPAIKWLMVVCVAFWVLAQTRVAPLDHLALQPRMVVRGALWQVATYMLLHVDLWHLAFNMLALYMFGCELERRWGSRALLRFLAFTGIAAGVAATLLGLFAPNISVVGISGAVFGLIVAWALLYPGAQFTIFPFPIIVSARAFAIIYIALDLAIVYGTNMGALGSVAHLGGAAAGYAYLKWPARWRRRSAPASPDGWYRRWRNRRIARKFRVIVDDLPVRENFLSGRDDDDRKVLH